MNCLVISNRNVAHATYIPTPEKLDEVLFSVSEYSEKPILLFPFWSWKVPSRILKQYKCYGMHTGFLTLGKGKGGSPIDNLKKLGVRFAQLNVFEMNEGFDDGKVILAIPIDISQDKAHIISWIDGELPRIVDYLTEDRPEIPERFKRI